MVYSDTHKYMIRHEAEPESAFVEFPVEPVTPLKTQRNLVTAYAYRDIRGTMHQKLVADIPKLFIEFKGIALDDALTILKDMIDSKIKQYGSKNFYINAFTLQYGWICGNFTLGTPDTAELIADLSNNLSAGVVDIQPLEFQAVEGFKIGGETSGS